MPTCAFVRVPALATYPDVTVTCGPTERDETDPQAVTNPALIIEVLSRSTVEYDAGDKFEHYKTLPSPQQYVLVSHREPSLEVWTLADDGWRRAIVRDEARTDREFLDVRELYESAGEP
ncbi:MAG: hypothetical protein QOI58_3332 [Thermoanaerobaculia bacterium]|nr:hypothetical protein [Thermoanaerobaculia bacterium]